MSETAFLPYNLRPDIAQRRIEAFRKRFREFEDAQPAASAGEFGVTARTKTPASVAMIFNPAP